jgi:hypothetical protein
MEERNLLSVSTIEPLSLGSPARGLVTIATEIGIVATLARLGCGYFAYG